MPNDFDPARRHTLRLFAIGAIGAVAAPALIACKKTLSCDDTGSLPTADVQTRTNAAYVDKAADPAKPCSSCNFYKPAGAEMCGACLIVKGPINLNGGCKLWAAKIAVAP
jgi:hypothetical protein